ncbi:alpha/beta fold hydrolase [Kitasatospora camelliae]|uniref:Alpha/beta hydrolase n=1 Tax=Kitasatospora camelliae TaxID=3156397 RepID=A0AAU8JT47_9ACTN
MATFTAPDGTTLAYRVTGSGDPLVCLPGGPMRASAYLGDLGGLSAHRSLIVLDARGTGESERPADPATYRCDRQVGDVEALRRHLGLDRMDLLAHSAAGNLAIQYAARFPERIARLALITPNGRAVGLPSSDDDYRASALLRKDQPWGPAMIAALDAVLAGEAEEEDWEAIHPLFYGRWNDTARAHAATDARQRNEEAAELFHSEGAYDPVGTRADLVALEAPVLVLAGELDGGPSPRRAAEIAEVFSNGTCVVQHGAGHYPWLDDATRFVRIVERFLAG